MKNLHSIVDFKKEKLDNRHELNEIKRDLINLRIKLNRLDKTNTLETLDVSLGYYVESINQDIRSAK